MAAAVYSVSYTKYVYNDYTPFNNYLMLDTGSQPYRKKSPNERMLILSFR